MGKRRFRDSTSGAVFVPRVDEATVAQKVTSGEWTAVSEPEATTRGLPVAKVRSRKGGVSR